MASGSDQGDRRYDGPFEARVLRGEGDAPVARLVLVGKAASSKADKARVLGVAVTALGEAGVACRYLVTPAGFIKLELEDPWDHPVSWATSDRDWKAFTIQAMKAASDTVGTLSRADLVNTAEQLVLGVDVEFSKHGRRNPVGQAAVTWDVASRSVVGVTGKSYPQPGREEASLIRNASHHNHVQEDGKLAVFVCHDLIAFRNPRRNPLGDRRRAATGLKSTIEGSGNLSTILHLAHTADRAGTWTPSWDRIRDMTAAAPVWGTAFRYRTKNNGSPTKRDKSRRPLARSLLRRLGDASVTTVIVLDPTNRDLVAVD